MHEIVSFDRYQLELFVAWSYKINLAR